MPHIIQNLWKEVYKWVEQNGYKIFPGYDFECYSEGISSNDYISGIWVALKEKE